MTQVNYLKQIIREELCKLFESDEIEVVSSEEENEPVEPADASQEPLEPLKKDNNPQAQAAEEPAETEPEEPEEDEVDKDTEDMGDQDADGDSLSKILAGATVANIEHAKKSEVMPGAQHIKVTFKDRDFPLLILFTNSGQIRFMYDKKVHRNI